jgi:hypothetical protein
MYISELKLWKFIKYGTKSSDTNRKPDLEVSLNKGLNFLINLKPKLKQNAKLYINVSNSSYSNYIIEVDIIIAKAAELIGYECEEIIIARPIKTSSQQAKKMNIVNMRESIIVLKNISYS